MRAGRTLVLAIIVERTLTVLSKPIDALMLYLVAHGGPIPCYVVGCALDFLFSAAVLLLAVKTKSMGHDVTGIDAFKEWIWKPGPWSLKRWVMQKTAGSYWPMILVGSVFHIEPDYVTLMLRKPNESVPSVLLRVTAPAVLWSIGFWTMVYWGAWEAGIRILERYSPHIAQLLRAIVA